MPTGRVTELILVWLATLCLVPQEINHSCQIFKLRNLFRMNRLLEKEFKPVGFWAPRTALNLAVRPRLWRQVFHAPVSIRFEESKWSQHPSVARWTYSQSSQKNRLQITFTSEYFYKLFSYRWRAVSDALSLLIKQHPNIEFTNVPVDISDCVDASVPENTFRFEKLPRDPHDLIPNPFLLEHRRAPQSPIKWKHKKTHSIFEALLQGNCNHSKNHVLQRALQH